MYKRYEKYKDSGVEWVGEVPEHWALKRFKNLVDLVNQKSTTKDANLPYIGLENVQSWTGKILNREQNFTEDTANLFKPGHVLFGKLRPYLAKGFLANFPGRCSSELLVLEPVKIFSHYLLYMILTEGFIETVNSSTYGAKMPRASWSFISSIILPLPSYEKQKSITKYLDSKTSEIDSLIADKEELIKRLEEYKQSIITEAVTKGLNPDVKMKDSGVEWIGEIPEHWDVKKVKYLSSYIGSGKTPRGGSEIYKDSGVLFLRSQNIYSYGLKLTDKVYISEDIDHDMRNTRVRSLDILLNITGASIGRSTIVPEGFPKANVNQHVCIVRPLLNKVIPSLLHKNVVSKSVQDQIFMSQTGSSREGLNFVQVANLVLAMPPTVSEQEELSYNLGDKIASIDTLIEDILNSIKILNYYRQSIIYEAVTGKIDVRDNQPERSEQLA